MDDSQLYAEVWGPRRAESTPYGGDGEQRPQGPYDICVLGGVISLMALPCGEKRDGARPAKCAQP
jgi:hypothetical protein